MQATDKFGPLAITDSNGKQVESRILKDSVEAPGVVYYSQEFLMNGRTPWSGRVRRECTPDPGQGGGFHAWWEFWDGYAWVAIPESDATTNDKVYRFTVYDEPFLKVRAAFESTSDQDQIFWVSIDGVQPAASAVPR